MASDLVHFCHGLRIGISATAVLRYVRDARNCLSPHRCAKPSAWFHSLHVVQCGSSLTRLADTAHRWMCLAALLNGLASQPHTGSHKR